MEFIIIYLIIFSISASLTTILKKKIEQIIPISVMGIILLIYIFGIFEFLDVGVIVVGIVSVLALCYLIKKVIESIQKKQVKELLNSIVTPGFAVYTILYIAFIIINHRAIFVDYDEFTHWGIIIKNISINHSFGMKADSVVQYSEYPPFTAIFQYLFLFFKGNYNESTIIIASNILYISIMITIIRNIEWKKHLKKLILYVPMILFLPMICYINFHKTIIADGILGIFFLYIIYTLYAEKDSILKKIGVTLGCCSIALIKLSGIGLSIIAFLIAIGDIFRNKESRKKKWKNIVIMLGVIAIFIISWQIKLNITKAPQKWNMSNINVNAIMEIPKNEQEVEIIQNYVYNIFNTKIITDKNITTFVFLLIIIAYSVFEIKLIKEKEEKKKYRYYSISLLVAILVYMCVLLLTYVFIIPKYEASTIPSYDRYMGTILLPIIMFHIIAIVERKQNMKNWEIITFIVILLIILPTVDITMKIVNWEKEDTADIEEREVYAGIEKYEDILTPQDKIYFTGNGTLSIYRGKLVDNYLSLPARIENTEIYTTGRISKFKEILEEGKYTHIYVFNATEKYKKKFKQLFENEEIKNKTLYKIEADGIFYEVK